MLMSSVIINYQNFLFICVLKYSPAHDMGEHTHKWIMNDAG
jgi:hypothetical protein